MPFCNFGVNGPFRSTVFPSMTDPTVLNQSSKKLPKKQDAKKGKKNNTKAIAEKGTGKNIQKVKQVKGKNDIFQHKRKLLRRSSTHLY
jgi:hypothetical protein